MIALALIGFAGVVLLGLALREPGKALLLVAAILFAYYRYGGGQ